MYISVSTGRVFRVRVHLKLLITSELEEGERRQD